MNRLHFPSDKGKRSMKGVYAANIALHTRRISLNTPCVFPARGKHLIEQLTELQ